MSNILSRNVYFVPHSFYTDRSDEDKFICRIEVFKGGKGVEYRLIKHERKLYESFVLRSEERLKEILTTVA